MAARIEIEISSALFAGAEIERTLFNQTLRFDQGHFIGVWLHKIPILKKYLAVFSGCV